MTRALARPPQPRGIANGVRPAVLTVLLVGLFALLNPVPAQAHIAGNSGSPTNYRAAVTAIQPAVPTVQVAVGLGGQWVHITNQGAAQIVVLGYRGEPFLRLSDNRVQVNERSATAAATGETQLPATDPAAEPKWVTQREGNQASWADARIDTPPKPPGGSVSWQLPLIVDGQRVSVLGTMDRVPAPTTWPWVAALVLLTAGVSALGWLRNWHRPVAATVAVGVLAFVLHLLGTGFVPQQSGPLFAWVGIGAVGAFALVVGAVAVVSTMRRGVSAPDRVVTAGIMVLILAAADITVLWNSQLPFAGPAALDRALTVLTYATALGLLFAGLRVRRASRPTSEATAPGTASS